MTMLYKLVNCTLNDFLAILPTLEKFSKTDHRRLHETGIMKRNEGPRISITVRTIGRARAGPYRGSSRGKVANIRYNNN